MTKTERLEKEFGKASAALDKAEEKAKEARADVLRAIEEGEGIDASRRREEAAKAAVITARREASDVAEVLRKARDEEETARRDAELADLRRRAESLAAEAEAGLKAGTKAVAEGLIVVGKAMVAAAGSEDAGDALRRVKAPPAGGARFRLSLRGSL